MKNWIKIYKTYKTYVNDLPYVIFQWRGETVKVSAFFFKLAEKDAISQISRINEKLPLKFRQKREDIYLAKHNKELKANISWCNHPCAKENKRQFFVHSYYFGKTKIDRVSSYVSQNKGGIKNVYGDVYELVSDLKRAKQGKN